MKKEDKAKRADKRRREEKIKKTIKWLVILLVIAGIVIWGVYESNKKVFTENEQGITAIKFKSTASEKEIEELNGKMVSITGYLSTLSPLNGEFAYLMNLPYQNCPYCVPGSSQITNTLAIFAKDNEKIEFTDLPVTVLGELEIGDFTDDFGYQYSVRLKDVTVSNADIDLLSENIRKYNVLAENGVLANLYECITNAENIIYSNSSDLKPIDIAQIEKTINEVKQYNSKDEYKSLIVILNGLESLCKKVNGYIENNEYDKIKNSQNQLRIIYSSFSNWISEGEL